MAECRCELFSGSDQVAGCLNWGSNHSSTSTRSAFSNGRSWILINPSSRFSALATRATPIAIPVVPKRNLAAAPGWQESCTKMHARKRAAKACTSVAGTICFFLGTLCQLSLKSFHSIWTMRTKCSHAQLPAKKLGTGGYGSIFSMCSGGPVTGASGKTFSCRGGGANTERGPSSVCWCTSPSCKLQSASAAESRLSTVGPGQRLKHGWSKSWHLRMAIPTT